MRTSPAFATTFAAVAAAFPALYILGSTYPSAKPPKMPTKRYSSPASLARRFGACMLVVSCVFIAISLVTVPEFVAFDCTERISVAVAILFLRAGTAYSTEADILSLPSIAASCAPFLCDVRCVCLIGPQSNDRDQGHPQIANPSEQTIESRLVDHRAGEQRVAVLLDRDGQALKPVRPLVTKMTLDPDLIDRWLTRIAC